MLDAVSGGAAYTATYTHAKANGCAPPAVGVRPGSVHCCGGDGRAPSACPVTISGASVRLPRKRGLRTGEVSCPDLRSL